MEATLYYNPRCGTCQKVLAALEARKIRVATVEYLKTAPSKEDIASLLDKLRLPPEALARTKEPVFQAKYAGKTLSRADWIQAFHDDPVLIERPVLVIGNRAAVIRPPETLEPFLASLG